MKQPQNVTMVQLVVYTEAFFFLCLISSFIYMALNSGFEHYQVSRLDIVSAGCYTVLLIASSFTLLLAEKGHARGRDRTLRFWLGATILLGAIFLIGQGIEYAHLIDSNVTLASGVFGTSFFTLTGFHAFHVFCGLIILTILLILTFLERLSHPKGTLKAVALYWHFVDIVWIVVFTVVYVLPKFSVI
jgi:cytochrome c oxidase subunit III